MRTVQQIPVDRCSRFGDFDLCPVALAGLLDKLTSLNLIFSRFQQSTWLTLMHGPRCMAALQNCEQEKATHILSERSRDRDLLGINSALSLDDDRGVYLSN